MDVREDHDGARRRSRSIAASDDARFRRRELLRTRTVVSEPSFSWNVTAMVSASDGAPCPCPCPIEGADPAAKPRARSSTAAHPRRGPASAREAEAPAPATTAGAAAPNVVTPHRAIWRTASRAPARSITSSLRFRATCFVRSSTRCRVFVMAVIVRCESSESGLGLGLDESVGLVRAKFGSVGISLLTLQGTGVPSRFPHAQDGRRRADLPVGSAQRRRRARGGASTRALSVARPEPTRAPRPNARHRESARFVADRIEANSRSDLRPPARSPHRSSAASRRRWRFPSSARARSSPRATRRTPPTRTTTC